MHLAGRARAAIARTYSADREDLETTAAALWALKSMGAWDETAVMTFLVTQVADVTKNVADGTFELDVPRASWITAVSQSARGSVETQALRVGG